MAASISSPPTTIRLSRAQLDLARVVAKRHHTDLHKLLRQGLQLYEQNPEDSAPLHEPLDAMILLKLTRDDHAAIHRIVLAANLSYSAAIRQALHTATRHLAGQHPTEKEAPHGA